MTVDVDVDVDVDVEFARLSRRLKRETRARLEAEAIAERGLRDLYQRQQEIVLLEAIAVAANEAQTIDGAINFAIREICLYTKWPVGHGFHVLGRDVKRSSLRSMDFWHCREHVRLAEFRLVTMEMEFCWGIGLPGLVWSTASATWVSDIAQADNFPRREQALQANLRAAFAFPVMVNTEVVAVLEFYASETLVPDSALLRTMSQIGTQLGRVVERQRAKDRLMHDALHDPLTLLPNRTLLFDRLNQLLSRVKREPGYRFAVLFLDLDRFKNINDSLGHMAGDQLLIEVGRRLVQCLRDIDSVGRVTHDECGYNGRQLVARLGGDEFCVIAENIREVMEPIRIAERLQSALAKPFLLGEQQVYTTASIGITLSSNGYEAVEDMLRDSDIAMYRAKASGRACWVVFDHTMHAQAVRALELEGELRMALDNQEFFLCYQPIVSLPDGKIRGFEALIRWQHPIRGLISPAEFIPLAEEIGLIRQIGRWVLEAACKQAKQWQDTFPVTPPLTMSVNLSAAELTKSNLLEEVTEVVQNSEILHGTLKLELTESVVMKDAEQACQLLLGLKDLGIQLSLDDFGTGYSSLNYLRRLPMDALKIDRSFVREMDSDPEKREIAQIIVMLARTIGLKVIAEGAETLAEVEHLNRMGCDFAQGYYFFRPLESQMAEQALQRQFGA
jgi:predicted signal transduction protein with EAL and GGDEF domain